jgi:MFS family permease
VNRRSTYAAVMDNRDFRLLLGALTISKFGSWAYNVALAVYVFDATRSPAWVAGATLSRLVTALVLSPYAGVIAERFERVRLMVTSDLAAFAMMGLLALAASLHAPVLVAIALAALTSAATSVYTPAVKATTPSLLKEDQLAAANSLESTIDNLAVIAGPAIGAGLLLLGPTTIAFAVNAVTFAFSAVVVSRLRVRSVPTDVTAGGTAGPVRQVIVGLRSVFSSPAVVLLAGFSVLASFVYGTDTVLLVVVSQSVLGTGAGGYGYLLAGLGIGGILATIVMNRIASSPRLGTFIAGGMLAYCLPTALITLVHAPAGVFALQMTRGAGTEIVDVLAATALQRLVARELTARVFGAFWAFLLGAMCLGALVAPALLAAIGLRNALLVMGCAIPLGVFLAYPRLRGIDRAGLSRLSQVGPRITLLEKLDIFTGAPRAAVERLAIDSVEERVGPGVVVVREGEVADDFYVLAEGQAAVSVSGAGKRRRSLGRLQAPAYFGEIGLLEGLPRTATVRTTVPCLLYRIDGAEFIDAMTTSTLSPAALGLAQMRLARTHPARRMTFAAGATPG